MSKRTVSLGFLVILGALCASPLGCGSDDSSEGNPQQQAEQTISQDVSAATGGTVEGPGVKLDFPPGALSEDTTITITIKGKAGVPGEATVASSVFDMGPNGLQFNLPVSVTLDFDPSNPPADSTAKMAYLDGSDWKPLTDSSASGSTATATTTHFTSFAIVWTPGSGQTGGMCADDFTACGGDIVGTWAYSAACATLAPGSDPFNGQCPTATTTLAVDVTGTVDFGTDGTYAAESTVATTMTLDIPKTCLPPGATCEDIADGNPVTDTGTTCTMTDSQPAETNSESGAYTASGTTLTMTKTGGTASQDAEYCVTGTTAQIKISDTNGQVVMYTLEKQ